MLGTAGGIGGTQLPVLGEAEAAAEDFSEQSDWSDPSDCSDESDRSDNSGFSGSADASGTEAAFWAAATMSANSGSRSIRSQLLIP